MSCETTPYGWCKVRIVSARRSGDFRDNCVTIGLIRPYSMPLWARGRRSKIQNSTTPYKFLCYSWIICNLVHDHQPAKRRNLGRPRQAPFNGIVLWYRTVPYSTFSTTTPWLLHAAFFYRHTLCHDLAATRGIEDWFARVIFTRVYKDVLDLLW